MPRFERFRQFTPVNSFTEQRAETVEIPTPEIGLRWGEPAAFDWSAQEREAKRSGFRLVGEEDNPPRYMRVLKSEATTKMRLVEVKKEGQSGYIHVNRMEQMRFDYREPRPKKRFGPQPYRLVSYELNFDLHPPGETDAQSE